MDRPANNVLQSLNKKLRSQHMHDCVRSQKRIVREKERERETAGGLEGVEGAERMGWGPKRYVGFWYKIHVPNAIFADFFVSWAGFCGKSSQGA